MIINLSVPNTTVKFTINATDNTGAQLNNNFTITLKDNLSPENTIQKFSYTGAPLQITLKVGMQYNISVGEVIGYALPAAKIGTAYQDTNLNFVFEKAKRYGYKRDKKNSDPLTRIEYLYDAINMNPVSNVFATAANTTLGYAANDMIEFNFGDWETFVNELAAPVMLNGAGKEDYELDKNDLTKKANGEASDLFNNTTYFSNAMVRFQKWKWIKRYQDERYEYVIFSDAQYDETYKDDAFIDIEGNHKDKMYCAIMPGVLINGILRSITTSSNLTIANNKTIDEFNAAAAENGSQHWSIMSKAIFEYIVDILTLIAKRDDIKSFYGKGNISSTGGYFQAGHSINTKRYLKGPFFGATSSSKDLIVLWIENLYANYYELCNGMILRDGIIKVRRHGPYTKVMEDEYVSTGIIPTGAATGSFPSDFICSNEYGYIPNILLGATGTYTAGGSIGYKIVANNVNICGIGGAKNANSGPWNLDLVQLYSYKSTSTTARLTYV